MRKFFKGGIPKRGGIKNKGGDQTPLRTVLLVVMDRTEFVNILGTLKKTINFGVALKTFS